MTRKPCLTVERRSDEAHQARIYTLRGKLIGDPVCYDFLETVRDELDEGHPHVVLEVKNLDRVNSTGIGILASIFTSAQNHGGRVCLVGVPQRLQLLIEATGLGSFLRTCDSMEAALAESS
jgi:anti-anti-sigma factor